MTGILNFQVEAGKTFWLLWKRWSKTKDSRENHIKMKEGTLEFYEELKRIKWFHAIGEDCPELEGKRVTLYSQMKKSAGTRKWLNFRNSINNRGLDFLDAKIDREDREFNILHDLIDQKVSQIVSTVDFEKLAFDMLEFKKHMEAFIRLALFEKEFENIGPLLFYIPVLYPIYKSGHFPCGWDGKMIEQDWRGNGPDDLPEGCVKYF